MPESEHSHQKCPILKRWVCLCALLVLLASLCQGEEAEPAVEVWIQASEMLSKMPTVEELDRAADFLNARLTPKRPDTDLLTGKYSTRISKEIENVLPIPWKAIALPPFTESRLVPPPDRPCAIKREDVWVYSRRHALVYLQARVVLEAAYDPPLSTLEKAILCYHSVLFVPHRLLNDPFECVHQAAEFFAKKRRELDTAHGLSEAIDGEVQRVVAGFGIGGGSFYERLAKWSAIADAEPENHLASSGLKHWLVQNCSLENVLRDPNARDVRFRRGARGIIEDYIRPEFLSLQETHDALGKGSISDSTLLKAQHMKNLLRPLLAPEFRSPAGYNSLSNGLGTTRHSSYVKSSLVRQFDYAQAVGQGRMFDIRGKVENAYSFELIEEGDGGPAFFIGLHSLKDERGSERIGTDSLHPIVVVDTEATSGASYLSSMYKEPFGLAPAVNRTDLFCWTPGIHYSHEPPEPTATNRFNIGLDVTFDLSNEGKVAMLADHELRALFSVGRGMTGGGYVVDSWQFGVVYHYPRTRYRLYWFNNYDAHYGLSICHIPLCLLVITPAEDTRPDDAFVCPYRSAQGNSVGAMGFRMNGEVVWTAAHYLQQEKGVALQKQIVTITTEQVRDLEATWREGVAKLEAWKRLFSSE